MREREPSRTAFSAATHRAVHQVIEDGKIFKDGLALTIIGLKPEEIRHDEETSTSRRGMRMFIAARSRFAETALMHAVEQRGVRQIVILGAGLDTFAYRNQLTDNIRIFEVDHPATQAWKRRRLELAGIACPDSLIYAPVDFENDTLLDGLKSAGFEPTQRTFFVWLGVVPYLTEQAIDGTLSMISSLPGGAEVVFDYSDPPSTFSAELAAIHEARAKRVAAVGEPFLSYFDPPVLHEKLRRQGFSEIDDVTGRRLVSNYFDSAKTAVQSPAEANETRSGGGHVLFAATKIA
jgi:methyltransferase (TIGR00027 family)